MRTSNLGDKAERSYFGENFEPESDLKYTSLILSLQASERLFIQ